MTSMYDQHLDQNQANYAPLTPLTFLERAAYVYPDRLSVVHGTQRFTWKQTYDRCRRLASALARIGVAKNDTVSVMLPNTPPMVEAHFGVPMCGAVLNTLNTRLDAETIAFMLRHAEAKVLITDREFSPVVGMALALLKVKPIVIDVDDPSYQGGKTVGHDRIRSVPCGRRSRLRVAKPGGRVGRDFAELHLGHDGRSERRGVSPSRRASERDQQHSQLGHAAARGVSVDAADVPLQRLVFSLDHGGARRRQRLSAPGRGEGRAGRDPRPWRHPYVRRADRLFHADQRAGGAARGAVAQDSRARSPVPRRPPRSSRAPNRSASI